MLQVTYRIKYNGTAGIQEAHVEFTYGTAVSRVPVLQTFTTIFYQVSHAIQLLLVSRGYNALSGK